MLSINNPRVTEGDSGAVSLSYTVTLSPASTRQVTVGYSDAGTGTATSGTDYTALPAGTLTFAAGDTSKTITVSVTGDTTDEPDETIVVALGSATGADIGSGTGRGTIRDDDAESVLSIDSPSVMEGNGGTVSLSYTVTLSPATRRQVTVGYSDAGTGTATSGTDYTALPAGTLTFAAGVTSRTITVSVTGDRTDEPDETILVSLGSATNATVSSSAGAGTGTITDDDAVPTVTLWLADYLIPENGGTTTVSATLSHPSSAATTITILPVAGGYTVGSDATIIIAAGETANASDTVTVTAVDDSADTGTRQVLVTGSAIDPHGSGGQEARSRLNLMDDDGMPSLTIGLPSVTEGDSGTASLDFKAGLSPASDAEVRVDYADAGTGTATSGTDYTALTAGTLTFAAGDTSKTFTVSVMGDFLAEGYESVGVRLSGAIGATIDGATGYGYILDDDIPIDTIILTVNDDSVGEGDGATTITVTATLDGTTRFPDAKTVSVSVAGSGTATAVDFAAVSNFDITIPAGEASGTGSFMLTPTADTEDETNETITVSGTLSGVTVTPDTISLTDDDAAPTSITLTVNDDSVGEGDGATTIRVTATVDGTTRFATAKTVRVGVAGSWTASAVDFAGVSAFDITIAAGAASGTGTFTLTPTNDAVDETDETITVSGTSTGLTVNPDTITLTDDDEQRTVTLALSPSSITESGATNASTVTATLDRASGQATTITVSAAAGTNADSSDFTLSGNKTLTIPAGSTSSTGTVTITAVDNAEDEPDKSVTVSGSATNSQGITNPSDVTLTITDDDAEPVLSIDSPSVTEGDSGTANLEFTVSLSAASGKEVTVAYAEGTGGTATSGTDYTAITGGTLTFAAGETSKTFDVSVMGDVLDESNETVKVSLSGPTNATISSSAGTGTGTITDDDALTVTLWLADDSILENGGTTTVSATLGNPSSAATTITIAAVAGAYTVGSDTTITIAAGQTANASDTVTITALDDMADTANRSVTVTGSASTTHGARSVTGAVLTLIDDDGDPMLSINNPRVTEGDSGTVSLNYTVTLSPADSRNEVTVGYSDAGTGTATSGTDYTPLTAGTLTFAAGVTSQTITVSVTGDTTDEPDETVVVALGSATGADIGSGIGTGTITDDSDTGGRPVLSINSPSVNETTNLTFTVSLSAASWQEVTVRYSDAGTGTGTATSGTDYTALTAGTLTFAAGEISKTITVSVRGDVTDEPDETVVVALGSATNATVSSSAGAGTGTITDDDPPPTVTLSASPTPILEEGSTTIFATLSNPSSAATTITLNPISTGAIYYPSSLIGTDNTITIPAGRTANPSDTVRIRAAQDRPNAYSGRSTGMNSSAINTQGVGSVSPLSLRVTNIHDGHTIRLVGRSVAEGAGTLSFDIIRGWGGIVSVDYSDAGTGTATSGTDYTALTAGTLTFSTSEFSKTITVSVTDDDLSESDETVVLELSNPTTSTVTLPPATAGIIIDDDGPESAVQPLPSITLTVDDDVVDEGDGATTITVTAAVDGSGRFAESKTVSVSVAGSGTASAVDFGAVSDFNITIAAGVASGTGTFTLTPTDDTVDETDETITVSGTLSGVTVTPDTISLTDDDAAPTSITLTVDDDSVGEGDGATTITVTATVDGTTRFAAAKTVRVGVAGSRTASAVDFTGVSAFDITIAAGAASGTASFTLTPTDDTMEETDETITVSGTSTGLTVNPDTITLTDDDGTPPTVTLALSPTSIAESGATNATTVTASLDRASSAETTITVSATAGTNAEAGDFTLSSATTLTIAAGSTTSTGTVTITAVDNSEDEPDKSVTVSGSATNSQGITNPSDVTLTITDDDDAPTVTLWLADDSILESGGTTTVSATLGHPSSAATTITIAALADAYTVGADDTITIAAGETANASDTVTITAEHNSDDTANRSVTVTGSADNTHGAGSVTGAVLTLIDDDGDPMLSINNPRVTEGDSGAASLSYTVTLSPASTRQVTVGYSDAGTGTATSGTDYTALTAGTLTFAAGVTSQTITVSVTGDTTDEPDETVVVALGSATGADIGSGIGTGTITDDSDTGGATCAVDQLT